MSKLTLPIVVGKKYVRRDGKVATIVSEMDSERVRQDLPYNKYATIGAYTYKHTGRALGGCSKDPEVQEGADLVADYDSQSEFEFESAARYAKILELTGSMVKPDAVFRQDNPDGSYRFVNKVEVLEWITAGADPMTFSVAPEEVEMGGLKFPRPEIRPLGAEGDCYYIPDISHEARAVKMYWDGGEYDLNMLRCGLVHLTEEAALRHSAALLAATLEAIE